MRLVPAMNAAFYVAYFLQKIHPNSKDLASTLFFEFTFLITFFKALAALFSEMSAVDERDVVKVLKWAMPAFANVHGSAAPARLLQFTTR